MKIRVGILGLPNVGKSTFFNSLTRKWIADAQNYPFCTIEPNLSPMLVPCRWLEPLSRLGDSRGHSTTARKTVAPTITLVDVAGLTKGAHRGEGLGNRFLATLRECDVLLHVLKGFSIDPPQAEAIIASATDPFTDAMDVNLELLFADIDHIERRLQRNNCHSLERKTLQRVLDALHQDLPARALNLTDVELSEIRSMGLLTLKPVIYALNVDEVDFIYARDEALWEAQTIVRSIEFWDENDDSANGRSTVISAQFEATVATADQAIQQERCGFLAKEAGIEKDEFMNLLSFNKLPDMIREMLDYRIIYTGPGVPIE
jgi:ribosome-binding ATPase YchF (GTP1/OBG family)